MSKTKVCLHLYKRVNLVPSWKTKLPTEHKHYRPAHNVYQCQKPLCRYTLQIEIAEGKMSECNKCHEPFIMDRYTLTLAKPKCKNCINRQVKPDVDAINELLEEL